MRSRHNPTQADQSFIAAELSMLNCTIGDAPAMRIQNRKHAGKKLNAFTPAARRTTRGLSGNRNVRKDKPVRAVKMKTYAGKYIALRKAATPVSNSNFHRRANRSSSSFWISSRP
jgi:hypothetical protein